MSYQNMTFDEFDALVEKLGFKSKNQKKGYGRLAEFLHSEAGRFGRMKNSRHGVPVEIAMLLRLMDATGYSPEQVEAIAPIVLPPTKQV